MKKKAVLSIIDSLEKINTSIAKNLDAGVPVSVESLIDCQDSAIAIGNEIEKQGEDGEETVHLLEAYCENLYQISSQQTDLAKCRKLTKKIQKQLAQIRNHVKYDLPDDRKQAVFLPYKASMWDSMESVWRAADADPAFDAFVIPIPYYDKNADGTFGEMHYEINEFPEDVPVMAYNDYDFEVNHPDISFIHNPYDEANFVTSVHPFFYAKNLKNFTDKLVYIPYFILGETMYESMCVSPGTVYADIVIAHSLRAKEDYVKHLKKLYIDNAGISGEKAEKMLRDKILPLGSPKIDKVVNGSRETYPLPEAWREKLEGKKAVLYNTGVSGILHGNEQELKKIKDTIAFFAGRDDVALWWRPHPLMGGTMQSMRPQLLEEYKAIVEEYKESGIGIYDDTADLHRAVLWTDMYYGDDSSLVYLYGVQGKPVVMQNINCLMQEEGGKRGGISYGISCAVSDSVYFFEWYYNRLYRLDVSEGRIHVLGKVPQEHELEVSLYSNIMYRNQVLWLVPSRAHALTAYHLDTGQWERYNLPDRIKSSAMIEDKLYMLSSDYRFIWIMNMEEKVLTREEIYYQREEQFPLSHEYYYDDLYLLNGKLYFLITHSNVLVEYDLSKGRAELVSIGDLGSRYQRLLYEDNCFWFLPSNEKTNIVCWDGKIVRESSIDNYPENFFGVNGFRYAIFREQDMYLFPYKGNMILRMDKKSMDVDCALKLNDILGIDNPRIDNVKKMPDGRVIMETSMSGIDSSITVFYMNHQVGGQYSCISQEDEQIDFEQIFERLESEKYSSVSAYLISEGQEYTLAQICGALGHGKPIHEAERNYFRSLYANSDGMVGIRIWEEVTG